jgi:acyl carrier protein
MSNVKTEVVSILTELYPFINTDYANTFENEPLTGRQFKLSKIDLVYFLFELEKRLGISFKECTLNDYGFSTINKISMAIENLTETNNYL